MQGTGARLYSLFTIISFFAAVALRLSMLLFAFSSSIATIIYYALIAIGIALIGVESFKITEYESAFNFKNRFHLDAFSYIASAGFFISFVQSIYMVYSTVYDSKYLNVVYLVTQCVIGLLAIASVIYYITIGLSFSDRNYDFRSLKLLHLAPFVWAIAQLLTLMQQAVSLFVDVNCIIKYAMLLFAILFFYFFAAEVENNAGAKPLTMFFTSTFSYLSVIYFIDRLMLILSNNATAFDYDSILAVAALLISSFAFFFEKNIISHKLGENNC